MAHDSDVETQADMDEQTLLINHNQSDRQPDQSGDEQKSKKQASWYIWRAFWAIVATLVLAVFIKGWVDAGGDVDVSATTRWL
jgi:hypothetical protein